MYSSNQTLMLSGDLEDKDLKNAFELALRCSDTDITAKDIQVIFQITEDGRMCIGTVGESDQIPAGWKKFLYNLNRDSIPSNTPTDWHNYFYELIVGQICESIKMHLEEFKLKKGKAEGTYVRGFLMEGINDCMDSENNGITNPYYGLVSFAPYTCFYAQ